MRQSGLKGVLEMTEILTGIYSLMKLPVIILTHEKKVINKKNNKDLIENWSNNAPNKRNRTNVSYIYFYFELISDTWM